MCLVSSFVWWICWSGCSWHWATLQGGKHVHVDSVAEQANGHNEVERKHQPLELAWSKGENAGVQSSCIATPFSCRTAVQLDWGIDRSKLNGTYIPNCIYILVDTLSFLTSSAFVHFSKTQPTSAECWSKSAKSIFQILFIIVALMLPKLVRNTARSDWSSELCIWWCQKNS